MIKKLLLFFGALTLLSSNVNAQTPNASGVLFVNQNVVGGTQSGNSWANALSEAADAFKAARLLNDITPGTVTQIWVAGGTYKPKFRCDNLNSAIPSDRYNAFVMVPNVGVYGGFAGTETTLAARDLSITSNASVLSGDLNSDDGANFSNYGENAHWVVIAAGSLGQATLSGFVISGANQNSPANTTVNGRPIYNGGGLVFSSVTLSIDNCIFRFNMGSDGGGMGGVHGTLTVTNSSFENNRASNTGGGFYIINDGYGDAVQHNGIFTNCRFVNNISTTNQINSIHYDDGNGPGIVFTNCTIYDTATTGRAMHYTKDNFGSEPKFRNTIFSINGVQDLMVSPRINEVIFQNCITNKTSFGNNISTLNNIVSSDPLFTDAAGGDFTLQSNSPAINAGNSVVFSAGQTPDLSAITTDLNGKDRIVNSIVDIGAYEFGMGVTSVKQDVLCYNNTTGSIATTIVGGTPPYSYSWNTTPVQTTQNITSLTAGTYTVTVTDDVGLTATHTVTITQPAAPTVTTQNVTITLDVNGTASVTPAQVYVGSSDNCGIASLVLDKTSFTSADTGFNEVTLTVTDNNNNVVTKKAMITVVPQDITVSNTTGQCGAVVNYTMSHTALPKVLILGSDTTDNLQDVQTKILASGQFSVVDMIDTRSTTPTLTTVNQYNAVLVYLNYFVQSPVALGNVLAQYIDGKGGVVDALRTNNSTLIAGAFNTNVYRVVNTTNTFNSNIVSLGTIDLPTHPLMNGVTSFINGHYAMPAILTPGAYGVARYTDNNFLVSAKENVGPANVKRVSLNFSPPSSDAQSYYWDSATDGDKLMANALRWVSNLPISNQTAGLASGSIFPVGTTTNTFEFYDSDNVLHTLSFDVVVNDTEDPVITCQADVTTTSCDGTFTYTAPTFSDNCTGATIAQTAGLASGDVYPLGQTINTFVVTDASGNTAACSFTVTRDDDLSFTASQVDLICYGDTNGSATVTAAGGKMPYTYLWSNSQTTATATGLAAGDYDVTITDDNGCELIKNFTIEQPDAFVKTPSQIDVKCFGDATGEATINVTGGTGAYTYLWSNGTTANTITGLAAGNYTVTVTDANLCTTIQSFTITQPAAALTATVGNQDDILCHGEATGEATVNVTGGTGIYTYSWNTTPVQTTDTATGLVAGTYIATVTDANNCMTTQSFTINEPSAITASAGIQENVLCHGEATGEATVNVTGGTGIYTYNWDTTPLQVMPTATGLAAGTYTVTINDANMCVTTQSFTITEPASSLVATAGTQVDVLCHGEATGEATVNATGGTGAYSYSWNTTPAQTTATAIDLEDGTYTATVTDANGCIATQSFTITEPATALVATAGIQVDVLCHGEATGEATVNATGGTGAYSYSWNTTPVQTTATAIDLEDGTYTVTVTDANGCSATQSFTITEPATALVATAGIQVDVLCHGEATGEATVTATGGTGAYSYSWNTTPVQTTATAIDLEDGTYTVTVIDANGCTATQSFTITEPASALVATAGLQVDVLCHGEATGEATVTATGGTGAYSYSWNTTPVQTTATAIDLEDGTYTVTVTDANGCTATQSFTITEPASALVVTAGPQVDVLCHGEATGTAYVNANGGTGFYTYSWDTTPVQTTSMAIGLTVGTYTATVTDINGCQGTQAFTITEPTASLVVTAGTQVDVLCHGEATGEATVTATGGTGAYSYSWNTIPVQTTATAIDLEEGTYTVTVTDANGCTATQSFTITEPATAMAFTPNTTQTDVLCNGQATGSATVAVNGGTGAYTYLWSNAATTNTITGLTAGIYTVTVTDANGCTLNNSFTITQPAALVATAGTQVDVLCHGNTTGEATVNVTGGTGAYTYSWDTTPVQTTDTATGLAAGTYTVTVTDANSCTTTQSFTITQPSLPLATTPNTSHTNVSCFEGTNGSATIAVNGGTAPYTYLWSNGQTNAVATGLTAGTYSVDVTDANGCTLSQSFTITEPTELIASAGPQSNVTCFGFANGAAAVNVTGGTGVYSYSWNTTPVRTTPSVTGLVPGSYTVTVTDANLCTTTQSFIITEPQQLTAAINTYTDILCYGAATGSATVDVAGGTLPYTYLWNNGQVTATATQLTAGAYTVVVTDANGCQVNVSVILTQPAAPLHLTASQVNVDCASDADGSITINATGGTAPYTYAWTPAVSTTNFADNLAVGNYNVVVTDTNGCSDIRYLSIMAPTAVTGYFTVTNADCYTTGSAILHASGGVAPYTYLWSNGNTTPNLTNVLPGTYTVSITDTNGCSYTLSTTINGTAPIIVTSAPQAVIVNGGETAVFTVEAQNVSYYQWQVSTDGGQTFTSLNSGGSMPGYYGVATATLTVMNAYYAISGYQYRVVLMQQNGCYILSDAAVLTVNPPIVGVDDIKHIGMDIYPNPASHDVFVKIPDFASHQNIVLTMYDLNGRLIKENKIVSEIHKIDVSGYESGIYIITIISDTARTDKKLIVNKKP
ncbi:T9SS type A sorting domain-containing protein [Flavobacterium hauense]